MSTAIEETYKITAHCFTLPNLTNNTKYIFRITANSPAGKTASYDGDFTIGVVTLPETGEPTECITVKANSYAFNSNNQVTINYSTVATSQCSVSYGNNSNRTANLSSSSTGTTHASLLDLLKLDAKTDLYYQINCNYKDNFGQDKTCKYNDVIAASKYIPYVVPPTTDNPLVLPDIVGEYFSTPEKASQSLATTAIAGTVTTAAISTLAYPQWLMYGFLWLKKKSSKPWGIVYDQSTQEPIPFAVVRILASGTNEQINQAITDTKGRFGFVLDSGRYTIEVTHGDYTGYQKEFQLQGDNVDINFDVPLNRENAASSWANFRVSLKKALSNLSTILTVLGLILTTIALILSPNIVNAVIFTVYLVQGMFLLLSRPPRPWGKVYDSLNSVGVKGAFVRLYDIDEGRQVDVQMADAKGRFGFIVNKKSYLVKIDAQGYKFPGMQTSKDLIQQRGNTNFIQVFVQDSLNNDIPIDPV
jgi:hypothetical protein